MNNKEEILLTFYNTEDTHPIAVMHSNGTHNFYKLKKMTREEIASLLGTESKVQ